MRLLCAAVLFAAACDNGNTCNTYTSDVGDVCLPATVAPNLPSVLDIRELCGPGCAGLPDCSAIYRNGAVVLEVFQDICSTDQSSTCIAMGCQSRVIHCTVPALTAGTYALQAPGGPARLLRVAAGGASSCRFAAADGGVQ